MERLTKREEQILTFIRQRGTTSNREITAFLHDISRITVARDLGALVRHGFIVSEGKGRSVRYAERVTHPLLRSVDVDRYFADEPDERAVAFPRFHFEIFKELNNFFTKGEFQLLNALNRSYREHVRQLSHAARQKEVERLAIELSWKSSRLEGNTYTLLDTEVLLKEHREAPGHTRAEAMMILNHKRAIDYIFAKPTIFRRLTLAHIRSIHDLLVKDLGVTRGFRTRPVGIIGTQYRPLDNAHQIQEAMEKMLTCSQRLKDPFSRALVALLMISYIQPFEDGNKRTARLVANALLLAHRACPLSFRSVNEVVYKKAIILFYEQNNIRAFKELFMQQFRFAVENYFLV